MAPTPAGDGRRIKAAGSTGGRRCVVEESRMPGMYRVAALAGLGLAFALAGPAGAVVEGPKVAWNLSLWGPPRAITRGVEALSKHVEEETAGKFTIKIHYGEALSKAIDHLDNIKLGAFEMALICTGNHPGKNPGLSVLDLPGLPLADQDVHIQVHEKLHKHPYIQAEFKRWNAMVTLSGLQPQSEIMGSGEPPTKMEMFKGMRIRALGGTGDALRNLGAVPTSVPAPEVYNALERGVFQAVAFPSTYGFAAYKIYEISKWYTTNLAPGANNCPTVTALDAYAALPPQYRDLLEKGEAKAYDALKAAHLEADGKNLADWRQRGLQEIVYPPEEQAKFTAAARPVWDAWIKEAGSKGVPAQELLDFVLAEAEAARKQLGR